MNSTTLANRLLPGETVVWSGRPYTGLLLTGQDVFLVPFSLLWGGFAVFWESSVLSMPHSPFIMKLWGIPFVLAGVYLIVGRFFVDMLIRRQTYYAVTDRRILIARLGMFNKFVALKIHNLPDVDLTERTGGRGTIRFGSPTPWSSRRMNSSNWTPSLDPTPQFIAIDDVRDVFDRIQATIERDRSAGAP